MESLAFFILASLLAGFGVADCNHRGQALDRALTAGVKAAFVYGDRDTRCNWLNGEAVTNTVSWSGKQQFSIAGYEDTKLSATYTGELTKQFRNLSFTRVFQAGHAAGYFQPRTVLEVFERSSVWDADVATGTRWLGDGGDYITNGLLLVLGSILKSCHMHQRLFAISGPRQ